MEKKLGVEGRMAGGKGDGTVTVSITFTTGSLHQGLLLL